MNGVKLECESKTDSKTDVTSDKAAADCKTLSQWLQASKQRLTVLINRLSKLNGQSNSTGTPPASNPATLTCYSSLCRSAMRSDITCYSPNCSVSAAGVDSLVILSPLLLLEASSTYLDIAQECKMREIKDFQVSKDLKFSSILTAIENLEFILKSLTLKEEEVEIFFQP